MTEMCLQPFRLGLSVFGALTFGLAGIVKTSIWSTTTRKHYRVGNVLFGASMMTAVGIGLVFGLPSMANTATVLFAMWVLEKLIEITAEKHTWPVVFGVSFALWRLALWCHQHPAFMQAVLGQERPFDTHRHQSVNYLS